MVCVRLDELFSRSYVRMPFVVGILTPTNKDGPGSAYYCCECFLLLTSSFITQPLYFIATRFFKLLQLLAKQAFP